MESEKNLPISVPEEDAQEHSLDAFVKMSRQVRQRYRRGLVGWAWYLATPALAAASLMFFMQADWYYLCVTVLCWMTSLHINRQHQSLIRFRGAFETYDGDDRGWRDALLETLDWPERHTRHIARLRLMRFLNSLTADDADLLTPDQRLGLYRKLEPSSATRQPEIAMAILRALPHIGDVRVLPALECLAQLPDIHGRLRRLRKSARRCIPLLEVRLASPLYDRQHTGAVICIEPQANQGLEETTAQKAIVAEVTPEDYRGEMAEVQVGISSHKRLAAPGSLQDTPCEILKSQSTGIIPRETQHPGMRLGFLVASWMVLVPYFAVETWQLSHAANPIALLTLLLMVASTQLYRVTVLPRHRKLARELAGLEDVREIGRLVDAMSWPDREIIAVSEAALTRLLPRLHATDAALLTEQHRHVLYARLDITQARDHASFLVALLRALEQVGDQRALSPVQALAAWQPYSKSQRAVHDAAKECLPYLEERVNLQNSSQTLLRASAPSEDRFGETLLKPAGSTVATDQALLLRARSDNLI